MKNEVFSLRNFEIKTNQSFFFDNNIWMYLFCPIGDYKKNKQDNISKFLDQVIDKNNSIIINNLILSEFSNACLRLDFNLWKNENQFPIANFKNDYFTTDRAKEARLTISNSIRKILKIADRYPDSFNALNIDNILTYYKSMDYNDAIIYNECRSKKWILVSEDSDFLNLAGLKMIKV